MYVLWHVRLPANHHMRTDWPFVFCKTLRAKKCKPVAIIENRIIAPSVFSALYEMCFQVDEFHAK
jgi:hypothetical protein